MSQRMVLVRALAASAVAATAVIGASQVAVGQQQPTFRAATDLVVVEVVAVGRDGLPIAGLAREQFQVTFDGRRREVVSADLIRVATPPGVAVTPDAPATPAPAVESPEAFYRLGVRPDPSDAGARPRTIRVTVKQSGVTLRYRRIIEIPASTGR